MPLSTAVVTCPGKLLNDVLVPDAGWYDVMSEDAAWFTFWPTGRTQTPDAFVNGRVVTTKLTNDEYAFFVQCEQSVMPGVIAEASYAWLGISVLRSDTGAEATEVKAAWLGPELQIDGRIAGYLDVDGGKLV